MSCNSVCLFFSLKIVSLYLAFLFISESQETMSELWDKLRIVEKKHYSEIKSRFFIFYIVAKTGFHKYLISI